MAPDWMDYLKNTSVSLSEIRRYLSRLRQADTDILDALMERIVRECPRYSLVPSRGFLPFSFHINDYGIPRPYVAAAVHPQLRNGIRVLTRTQIAHYERNTNAQLRFQSQIQVAADIDIVIRYLKDFV
jgi:hypothetical protein